MDASTDIRLDKWLWAVRLFKTRALAAAACRAGQVKIAGHPAKPAHSVRPGEVIAAQLGVIIRTVRVVSAPPQRVAAKLVPEYLEDLTPPEEYEKQRQASRDTVYFRPKGMGRPTKRERRRLNPFLEP